MDTVSLSNVDSVVTSPMQSISFHGCFGWLHTAPPDVIGSTAVVLCSGLKTDDLTGYRSFRKLADTLARAGFPTLRFHYPGTGDSCDPGVVEHWSAWQQSIHEAADWVRDYTGARQIVLCGFRLGATLATVVAEERADVAALVLLEPVVRGRSFIRQLIIEANIRQGAMSRANGLDVGGLHFSDETVRLISQVDLHRATLRPDCPIAVYAQVPSSALSKCVQVWKECGAEVTLGNCVGLEAMLRPTFMSHEAPAALAPIAAWLRASVRAAPSLSRRDGGPANAEIRTAGCIETPLRFGAGGTLFGILCRPSARAEADLAVVIGNTSGNPHCAPVTVDLARRLAIEGFASLRMDFAGLGDSIAPNDAETHVFETDRRPDIAAAIDALTELDFRRFAIHGLCSGAYHAFHAAVGDSRVCALLLVNLPQFQWSTGGAIEVEVLATQSPLDVLQKIRSERAWKVLLQSRLNLRRRLIGQGIWFARRAKALSEQLGHVLGFKARPNPTRESMGRLSQRARTLLLFSEGDAGIAALAEAFEPKQIPPSVTIRILPELDHPLTGRNMRRIVADHMVGFLNRDQDGVSGGSPYLASSGCP
jgi:pimeloyl-ACP methyl ester carboxylesterase